jgi:DMSO/TMAO reductase YedYZ molybdopterin-dependent catalytic subunit
MCDVILEWFAARRPGLPPACSVTILLGAASMVKSFVTQGLGASTPALVLIGMLSLSGPVAQEARPVEVHDEGQAGASLRVGGEVDTPLQLAQADLAELPRLTVRATDHGGTSAEFEGVPLHEILRRAGAPLGERLRGEAAATYIVVGAADGYRAVFALAELDPLFTDRVVLLADRRDGQPMATPQGPLRIVVPDEKRQARWVRMVESITVRRDRPADPMP